MQLTEAVSQPNEPKIRDFIFGENFLLNKTKGGYNRTFLPALNFEIWHPGPARE